MGLFSLKQIVLEHYMSIKRDSSRMRFVMIFLMIPAFGALVGLKFTITKSVIKLLVPALSVLIGFSINTLALLASQETSERTDGLADNLRNLASYALVTGIVLLIFTIALFLLFDNQFLKGHFLVTIISVIIYFAIGHYILTLLLIPSRLYVTVET